MKMSKLLQEAVDAVKRREIDPRYVIDMGEWHSQKKDGTCHVCVAGARFADNLLGQTVEPYELIEDEHKEAEAIDSLRQGYVGDATDSLDLEDPQTMDRDVTSYSDSPAKWHKDMKTLITDLQSNDE